MNKEINYQAAKIYIMNILLQKGYDSIEEQALNVFTEMFIKYVQNIGIMSKKISNLNNRNVSNIIDVFFGANILNIDLDQLYKRNNDQQEEKLKVQDDKQLLKQNQQIALKSLINDILRKQKGENEIRNQEVEQTHQNIKLKDNEFKNKGGVLFQGPRVDQTNNYFHNHLDGHICQISNDYYYNQTKLENKIVMDESDIKKIKNDQKRQLNQEIADIKYVAQNDTQQQEQNQSNELQNPFGKPQKKIKQLNYKDLQFDI